MDSPGQQLLDVLFNTVGSILSGLFSALISATFDTIVTPLLIAISQSLGLDVAH